MIVSGDTVNGRESSAYAVAVAPSDLTARPVFWAIRHAFAGH